MKKTVLPNGMVAWGLSPSKYMQEAVKNVEEHLVKQGGRKLVKRASDTFLSLTRPESSMRKKAVTISH